LQYECSQLPSGSSRGGAYCLHPSGWLHGRPLGSAPWRRWRKRRCFQVGHGNDPVVQRCHSDHGVVAVDRQGLLLRSRLAGVVLDLNCSATVRADVIRWDNGIRIVEANGQHRQRTRAVVGYLDNSRKNGRGASVAFELECGRRIDPRLLRVAIVAGDHCSETAGLFVGVLNLQGPRATPGSLHGEDDPVDVEGLGEVLGGPRRRAVLVHDRQLRGLRRNRRCLPAGAEQKNRVHRRVICRKAQVGCEADDTDGDDGR
jgi:hypothetical protein